MTKYLNKFKRPYLFKKQDQVSINTEENVVYDKETDTGNFRSEDPWNWEYVLEEEVCDLLEACYIEVKSRGVMIPLVFLPFRPMSDVLSTKAYIRKFFSGDNSQVDKNQLIQELPVVDIYVIIGIIRWCWLRLIDGVVGWNVYEAFKKLEKEAKYPHNAFFDYIPIIVKSRIREKIILGFFDILSAIAAYSKINGLCGDKLSRTAGWWAFNFKNKEQGFHRGYSNWKRSADANEHLFFAYLRSIKKQHTNTELYVPNPLPLSLVKLLDQTPYPLSVTSLMTLHHKDTLCIDILSNIPSPNIFTILQRVAIQSLDTDDEISLALWKHRDHIENALTEESKRILMCISNTLINTSSSKECEKWEEFMNFGFDHIENRLSFTKSDSLHKIDKQNTSKDNLDQRSTDLESKTDPVLSLEKNPFSHHVFPFDNSFSPINGIHPHSKLDSATKINTEWLNESTISNKIRINLDESFWAVWIDSCSEETPIFKKTLFGKSFLFEIELDEKKWVVIEEQNNKRDKCISFNPFLANSSVENKQNFLNNTEKHKSSFSNDDDHKIRRTLSEYFKHQKNKFKIIQRYKTIRTKKKSLLEYKQDMTNKNITRSSTEYLYRQNDSLETLNSIKVPFSYGKIEYMLALNNKKKSDMSQIKQDNISDSKIENEIEKLPIKDLNLYSYSLSANKRYGILNEFNLKISDYTNSTSNIHHFASKLSSFRTSIANKPKKELPCILDNINDIQNNDAIVNISNTNYQLKRYFTLKKYTDKLFRNSKHSRNTVPINNQIHKDQ
ncbi:hypothetical protein T552_02031 [Pneumocystis carinii B80]|uniref:Meiotically up-regulated protein Msb1/Mug8 domain-containing protein n=1 Tax=Pneumocystis carinii (strain B80) TaxID=1408658 RepID=A0A0W4ZIG3_PNEC8|nr:hypothetical protein T552_02031 [Pneumocystis carinii B80]KTW28172.1 hypothetical protein T552_02031 [Pneumocystis carinii B80]